MTDFTMNRDQRRTALLRARSNLEGAMYSMVTTLGFDPDELDYLIPDKLWQTEVVGVSLIDDYNEEQRRPYSQLKKMSEHLSTIVEKLEGPNRVV
jgi:hypothetical protein